MKQIEVLIDGMTVRGEKDEVLEFVMEYKKATSPKQKINVNVDTKNLWDTSDFFEKITSKLDAKGVNLNWK